VAETILEGKNGVTVTIGPGHPFVIIGERINPTGRSKLGDEFVAGDYSRAQADAIAQVEAGAKVLDVNAGIPGKDETKMLTEAIQAVQEVVDVPICIDSSTFECLEPALEVVQGKPILNSVTGEDHHLEQVLPLVKRFGAAVIGMAHEDSISQDPDDRFKAAKKIVEAAEDHGIPREDVLIDPLAMPLGGIPEAGQTLFAICRRIRDELDVNMSCGASNISFGLPDRHGIDAAFLPMLMMVGMYASITNPLAHHVRRAILAGDVLLNTDTMSANWIKYYREREAATSGNAG
jgi:5-methyltetrahydrofolate--homocysteine methyltransferase